MTAADADVGVEFDFDVSTKRREAPSLKFRIDGEPYKLKMPKLSVAVGLLNVLEREDEVTRIKYGLELARAMWGLIDYVEKAPSEEAVILNPEWAEDAPAQVTQYITNPNGGKLRGRSRIIQRLNDPDDDMDVDALAPILGRLLSVMFQRPTTTPPESSSPPDGAGSGSQGTTDDTPVATS